MKTINGILELLGSTLIISLSLLVTLYVDLELIYELGIIGLGTILAITMYILSTRYENSLEMELELQEERVMEYKLKNEELEKDYAQQVEVIDELEKRLATEQSKSMYQHYKDTLPFAEESDTTEQQYICPQCGKPMTRMTEHTVFCDNIECSRKRYKKSEFDTIK